MKLFRWFSGLVLVLVGWSPASPAAPGVEPTRRLWLSHVPVVYQANHDPGVVVLTDKRRLSVLYDEAGGLAWRDVDGWKPGRSLALAYSTDTGPVLVDGATGRYLPVQGGWRQHPLDVYLDGREGRSGSTMDMVDWAAQAARLWRLELVRLQRVLLARASPAVGVRMREAQSRWERYEEAELALIGAIDGEEEGTLGRVVAAGRRLALVRERALQLYGRLQ